MAEVDDGAVAERDVLELHPGAGGQVRRGARSVNENRQPGDVVGLHVRFEHGHDRNPLRARERDVLVDQVDMRIHHREALLRLAAEQVRGAGGVVVQELPEEHHDQATRPPGIQPEQILNASYEVAECLG